MRLCYMAPASVIHTVRWVNAMAARGHDVSLITMHAPARDAIDQRVHVIQLRVKAPAGYYLNVFEARKQLRQMDPDVLHAHYASGYGTLARLVRFNPTLLSVWGSDVFAFPERGERQQRLLTKNLQAATHVTSTSHAMKARTETFLQSKRPIDVIPFGIDLDRFQPAEAPKQDNSLITIGTVKKLEPIYGIDRLLRSICQLLENLHFASQNELAARIRVRIVGDGPQKDELKQQALSLGLADITTFCGAVPNEDVPEQLHQLDIYEALSRQESFGVAVLEASACGVPVLTSDAEGLPEVVQDGETGFTVDGDDIEAAAEKLQTLATEQDLRRQMGEKGRTFVRTHYDWQANVSQMEAVYQQLAGR
ncbi:O-antigen biosynthesis protein WlbH [Barrientosiimonas marina]|uniref:Glycosyltransferase n=1 Tax=Lentibacillus kimchii TaxID=1542911 RepID=A0ABW2USA9_9BACI